MEAQAVHWNTSYGSLDKCYERENGIAIVAFLFQVYFHVLVFIRDSLEVIVEKKVALLAFFLNRCWN